MLIFLGEPHIFLKKLDTEHYVVHYVSTFASTLWKVEHGFIGCGMEFSSAWGFYHEPLLSFILLAQRAKCYM